MKLYSAFSKDIPDGGFGLAISPRQYKEGEAIPPNHLCTLYIGVQTDLADNFVAAGIIGYLANLVENGEALILFSPGDIPDDLLPDGITRT